MNYSVNYNVNYSVNYNVKLRVTHAFSRFSSRCHSRVSARVSARFAARFWLLLTIGVLSSSPVSGQYGYAGTPAGPVHVPRSVLERYVGDYVYPAGNTVSVRLRGDTLFREAQGQRFPFVPISETRFWAGPVFTAEFVIDQAGGVTQILSDGVAVEYRLLRKTPGAATPPARSASSPAPEAAAVRVPRTLLERYAGQYEFIPGQMGRNDLFVVVRLTGETLHGQMSGLEEVILTPITETRFKLGSTSIVWEFVSDQGGVTLVLGSGSQQMKLRRKR